MGKKQKSSTFAFFLLSHVAPYNLSLDNQSNFIKLKSKVKHSMSLRREYDHTRLDDTFTRHVKWETLSQSIKSGASLAPSPSALPFARDLPPPCLPAAVSLPAQLLCCALLSAPSAHMKTWSVPGCFKLVN